MLRAAQLDEGTQDYGGDSFTYASRRTLEYQLEYALVFGTGSAGNALIRELAVWHREWREWRDTIMPKFIEAFPGRRPAAAYICGELPMRPVEVELPLASSLRQTRCVYVVDRENNDGFTYSDLPEPYQPDEARHLFNAGVIDADELRRYRGYSRAHGLRLYCWEVGK
jgi:hypothetical protein